MTARDERVVWTVPGAAPDPSRRAASTLEAGQWCLISCYLDLKVTGQEDLET